MIVLADLAAVWSASVIAYVAMVFVGVALIYLGTQWLWGAIHPGRHRVADGRPMVADFAHLRPAPAVICLGSILEHVTLWGIRGDGEDAPQVVSATLEVVPPEDVTALSYLVRPTGIPDTGPVLHLA